MTPPRKGFAPSFRLAVMPTKMGRKKKSALNAAVRTATGTGTWVGSQGATFSATVRMSLKIAAPMSGWSSGWEVPLKKSKRRSIGRPPCCVSCVSSRNLRHPGRATSFACTSATSVPMTTCVCEPLFSAWMTTSSSPSSSSRAVPGFLRTKRSLVAHVVTDVTLLGRRRVRPRGWPAVPGSLPGLLVLVVRSLEGLA
jgi:hypothetical protein